MALQPLKPLTALGTQPLTPLKPVNLQTKPLGLATI